MRFLADESCDFAVVRALRAAGHDVLAVAELSPQSDDRAVIDLAAQENRILLTEDKDFGQLVYANSQPSGGIIFIRFPANTRQTLPTAVLKLIQERGERLTGGFVVLAPGAYESPETRQSCREQKKGTGYCVWGGLAWALRVYGGTTTGVQAKHA